MISYKIFFLFLTKEKLLNVKGIICHFRNMLICFLTDLNWKRSSREYETDENQTFFQEIIQHIIPFYTDQNEV